MIVIYAHFLLQNEANDAKVNVPTEAPTPTAEWYVVRTKASQGHSAVLGTMGPHKRALSIILIKSGSASHSVLRVCLPDLRGGVPQDRKCPTEVKVTLKA